MLYQLFNYALLCYLVIFVRKMHPVLSVVPDKISVYYILGVFTLRQLMLINTLWLANMFNVLPCHS